MATMLVNQTNPVRLQLFSYVNTFFWHALKPGTSEHPEHQNTPEHARAAEKPWNTELDLKLCTGWLQVIDLFRLVFVYPLQAT